MYNLNQSLSSQVNTGLDSLTIQELLGLYEQTIGELQNCARIVPSESSNDNDSNEDIHEHALLDFEAGILNQAATAQIRSKDDVLNLMDLWAKIADINTDDVVSMSDRIVMNIFRHMNGMQFSKG